MKFLTNFVLQKPKTHLQEWRRGIKFPNEIFNSFNLIKWVKKEENNKSGADEGESESAIF